MTDFRALCAELAVALASTGEAASGTYGALVQHARAALAEPASPAEGEVAELALKELEQTVVLLMPVTGHKKIKRFDTIRAALKRLQELENKADLSPAPAPAEGDVADEARYLAKELRDQADDMSPALELFGLVHRAADLLEQRHPTPVPVGERLPGPEDCDAEGKVWGTAELGGWTRVHHSKISRWRAWLPAHTLPLPQGEVE